MSNENNNGRKVAFSVADAVRDADGILTDVQTFRLGRKRIDVPFGEFWHNWQNIKKAAGDNPRARQTMEALFSAFVDQSEEIAKDLPPESAAEKLIDLWKSGDGFNYVTSRSVEMLIVQLFKADLPRFAKNSDALLEKWSEEAKQKRIGKREYLASKAKHEKIREASGRDYEAEALQMLKGDVEDDGSKTDLSDI